MVFWQMSTAAPLVKTRGAVVSDDRSLASSGWDVKETCTVQA